MNYRVPCCHFIFSHACYGFSGLYPGNYLLIGGITGGHAVTKVGAGQLQTGIGSIAFNFTNLTVAAGDFMLAGTGAGSAGMNSWGTGTTPLVQSGGTLDCNGTPTNGPKTLTINGNGYHNKDFANIGALTDTGMRWFTDTNGVVHGPYVAGGSNLSVVLGSDSTIGVITPADLTVGAISGNYSLTKTGSGTAIGVCNGVPDHYDGVPGALVITHACTYTGSTTISDGTIRLSGGNNRLPTGTAVTLANMQWAILNINGTQQTIASLAGGGAAGGNVSLGSGTLTVGNASSTSYAGVISGTGGLVKQGAGTLILAGANTYTGATTVSTGTLQLGDGTTNGAVAGNITNNSRLVFNNGSSQTYGGVVGGSGTVTKIGAGALALSGANSYGGLTTVTAGTLELGERPEPGA